MVYRFNGPIASIRTLKKLPKKLEDICSTFRRFEQMSVRTNVLDPLENCLEVYVCMHVGEHKFILNNISFVFRLLN